MCLWTLGLGGAVCPAMLGYSAPDFTEAFRASILDNPKSLAALRETEVRWRVISGVSVQTLSSWKPGKKLLEITNTSEYYINEVW
jgi:hypothetical protein